MSGFRFPLEKVLELRLREEQRRARVVADAKRDANAARQAVRDLEALRNAGREGLTRAHSAGHSVGQLQNLEWVLQRMENEIEVAEAKAEEANQEASRRMAEFRKAVQERQSLDRLKTRRKDDWMAAERARDQKDMDEFALARHVRAEELGGVQGGEPR